MDLPEMRTSSAVLDDCLGAAERYNDLRELPESKRGDTWEQDRRRAAQHLLELNAEFDLARSIEAYAIESAAWREALAQPAPRELSGPTAAFAPLGEARSAGELATQSDAYANRSAHGFDEVEVRNLLTGTSLGSSNSHLFVPVGSPSLAAARQRRFFLRDVMSVQSTGLASVPYIREVSSAALEGGASSVQEASAKPEVTMSFEQGDAPIRKIAAWIQATNEALDDAPTLRGYIDTRLAYMLQVTEEYQILSGNGTAPNLRGITQYTTGNMTVQTQALGADLHAAVGSAIGKVENVDLDADAVAVNPLDFWAAQVARRSTWFDGNVHGGGPGAPFESPPPMLWGLPVIRTRSLASGTSIVGSWRLGATLFDREQTTIRSTDSHASLFTSNTVVILAEERIGLAVHRPDGFVIIS